MKTPEEQILEFLDKIDLNFCNMTYRMNCKGKSIPYKVLEISLLNFFYLTINKRNQRVVTLILFDEGKLSCPLSNKIKDKLKKVLSVENFINGL